MKSIRVRLIVALLLFSLPALWILLHSYPALPAPLVFSAEFSEGKPGQTGPLLVTGHPSAGDFLFVKWLEKNRIVFCYNSWGKTEVLESKPVQLEAGKRLQLRIAMPSITPDTRGVAPKDKPLQVECDGAMVLEASPHFYPVDTSVVAFGKNLFGKTLCGKKLAGELFQENGVPFKGGPGSFFTFQQRLETWVSDCWWEILSLGLFSLLFFRLSEFSSRSRHSPGSFSVLDGALLHLSRYLFRIHTPVFLIGMLLSLTLLSLAGRKVSSLAYIENFHRFYPHINVEAYFYPSSSLFKSIAESESTPDQTLVIIGGSSVFNGVGQPVGKIWTEELQKELGPSYKVLNFAFRGGQPTDTGAIAAEIMRKEGRRVIYVSDFGALLSFEPDGRDVYRYVFWDAYYKGLLRENPERVKYFAERQLGETDDGLLRETKVAMWLNSIFYSLDLWNYVGYEYVFPVWTNWFSPFYEPRRKSLDPEIDPGPVETRFLTNTDAEMNIVRGTIKAFFQGLPPESKDPDTNNSSYFKKYSDSNFAAEIRPDTILVMTGPAPFYRQKLSPFENERLRSIFHVQWQAQMEKGFPAIDATNELKLEDYVDRSHLSPSGGKKIARLVATKIKEMDSSKEKTKP